MSDIIYSFIHKYKKQLISVCITYILATIANVLNGNIFKSFNEVLVYFINIKDFTNALMYLAFLSIILISVLEPLSKKLSQKYSNSHILADYFNKNTDSCFDEVDKYGGYSWGEDRTVLVCDDLFEGWKPEQLVIDEYDSVPFEYDHAKEKEMISGYNEFKKNKFKKQIEQGNNNPRWMLTNFHPNFNKNYKKIFLSLQKTEWSQTSYSWDFFKSNPEIKKEKIDDFYSGDGRICPNSLCLHLIVETVDNKVLLSRISNNKRNDYPKTLAATIGEQIEITDFVDGTNIRNKFIYNWVKRAFEEEFGFEEDIYSNLVNEDSIRILAIDMEGDIYNFSLVCAVRLHITLNELEDYMRSTPARDKELTEIIGLNVNDIPTILIAYKDTEERRKYHPSTYLRLLLYYIHKKGCAKLIQGLKSASVH